MKKEFKKNFSKIKTILKTTLIVFLFVLFFVPFKDIKSQSDIEVTFDVYGHTNQVSYSYNDVITEIPSSALLDSYNLIFAGWYENDFYSGTNYYGEIVDSNTPIKLYARVTSKFPVEVYNSYTITNYGDGYEITSYTGNDQHLNIPSYFYEETPTPDLYEIKNILSIKDGAFINNTTTEEIMIPSTIINLDVGVFNDLSELTKINVDGDNSIYSDKSGVLYNKDKTELVYFPRAISFNNYYELPEGLEVIKSGSFVNATYLEKLILPSTLLEIESEAFVSNTALKTVIAQDNSLTTISSHAFLNNNNLEIVMIPNTATYVGKDAFSGSNSALTIYYQDEVVNIPGTWASDWNSDNYNVIGEYDSITYEVVFKSHDGTIFDTQIISFGRSAILTETDPIKEGNTQYLYPFTGWDKSHRYITSDLELLAQHRQTPRSYNVVFHDANGLVIGQLSLPYGGEGNNNYYMGLTKEPTAQYTYRHIGWNVDLRYLESDTDAHPIFEETIIQYDVTFYSDDGLNMFKHLRSDYGSSVSAPLTNPTKDSTTQFEYLFAGWFLDLEKTIPYDEEAIVIQNVDVYPKFIEKTRKYNVTFYNHGVLYDAQEVEYGTGAVIPVDPTRPSTQQFEYNFIGWDRDFSNITSNLNINATYQQVIRVYEVNFYNELVLLETQNIEYGKPAVTPTEPTKESTLEYSYLFRNWDKDYSFITDNLDLYAIYDEVPNSYTINYETNGGTLISSHLKPYGSYLNVPIRPTKVGHEFIGWYSDIELMNVWDFNLNTMPAEDITLYVKWNVNSYTINFNSNGGSFVESLTQDYGSTVIEPLNPIKTGHDFVAWYSDINLTTLYVFTTMPAENITLYASWTINQYTITFNSNGGTLVESITDLFGSELNIVNPTRVGYTFTGWYFESSLINKFKSQVMPAEDLILYAGWNINQYTITFNSNGGTLVEPTTQDYGTSISAPFEPTKIGHSFIDWFSDIELTTPYVFTTMPAENITLYAGWSINQYTITFNSNGGTLVDPITTNYGSTITKPLNPNKVGHTFAGWYIDVELTTLYTLTTMPAEDFILYANWTVNEYTITFNSNGGTSLSSITADYGSAITKPLNPNKVGYTFIGWYSDIDLIMPYTFTTMPAENITLYAKWQVNEYTITFNSNEGSLVDSVTALFGSAITAPIEPERTGYTFTGWYSDLTLTTLYTFTTMPAEDITLYASWTINEYLVTFYRYEAGTVNNSIFYTEYVIHGSEANLPSTTPVKSSTEMYTYEFSGWSISHTNITSPTNIYPEFTQKLREYDVNFYNEDVLIVSQKVAYGTSAVEPDTPLKEATAQYTYLFIGWDKDFTNIKGNINLYANFEAVLNSYTVTFYEEDQVTVISLQTINYGRSAVIPEAPLKEPTTELVFTFVGWDKSTNNITGDLDVYAVYTSSPREYIVRFYSDLNLIQTQSVAYGESAIAPDNPTKDKTPEHSYIFTSWDKDFSNITSDLEVYALYDEVLNSYTITFHTNGGTLINPITQDYGTSIIKPLNPTRIGYTFAGWDISVPEVMPAEDLTIKANWTINQYTITFNSNGGSLVDPITALFGSTITAPIEPERTGYTFTGWYSNEALTILYNFSTMPAKDITIYARWSINQYTITFNSNGGSLVSPVTQGYNSIVNAPLEPKKTGYSFTNWYSDVELTTPYTFSTMPAEHITLYAGWSINAYTITFNSNGGTLIDSITQNYGTGVYRPIDPSKIGHTFINWYTDVSLRTPYTFSTMPGENINLYAGWEVNKYSISFNTNGGDSLSPVIAAFGSSINEPTPTRAGHSFVRWYLDMELTTPYTFTTMPAENITLYAKWLINEYTVTFYNEDLTYLGEVAVIYGEDAVFLEPSKESTPQYEYHFSNWSTSILNVKEDLEVYAVYTEVLRKYQVTFYKNEFVDGETNPILKSTLINYGSSAVAPSSPTKNPTVKYTYTFTNWDKDYSNITSDLNIYPVFSDNLREYVVKFILDDYTTVIEEVLVPYGEGAIITIEPVKESTPRYHYEFVKWDKDFSNITGNLNVYAQFKEVLRSYPVTFYNGEQVVKIEEVPYGRSATAPTNPTKNSTAQYHYQFTGWNEVFSNITSNLNVYAEYEEVLRQYTIYFYDDNEWLLLGQTQAYYGESAIYNNVPVKEEDNQYTYEFIGWDKDISFIERSMAVYAVYEKTIRSYEVFFYSDDGTTLMKVETVLYGHSATPPENPIKEATAQYTYIFSHWNLDYTFIDGHTEIYATYEEVLNRYTVSFYNDDLSLYETVQQDYGSTIRLPINPTKEATIDLEFSFAGWYKDSEYLIPFDENETVNDEMNFYAKFDQTIRVYEVKFYNGSVLYDSQQIKYGEDAVRPSDPTKESTAQFNFEFNNWSESFTNVKNDLNIYAQYNEILRIYTVKFFNGTIELESQNVPYGTSAIRPVDPTREKTHKFEYVFIGWDRDFSSVDKNLNVYANFKETLREFTVNFYNAEGEIIKTEKVQYDKPGTAPEAPVKEPTTHYEYTFAGWDKSFSFVYNDLDIYPQYEETARLYTVNFYNEDELINTQKISYGKSAVAPSNPFKDATPKYKYIFINWSEDFTNIISDLNIYAEYEEVIRKYQVSFYDDDHLTIISEQEVNYGDSAIEPETPLKESTVQYNYEFISWSEDFSNIKEDLVVFAQYQETIIKYEVNFYSEGILISSQMVNYGSFASAPNDPTKEGTEKYNYNFTGWSENFIHITSNLEVHAQFVESIKTYNVIFYMDDQQSVLKNLLNVPYGTSATPPANPTKRPSIEHEYTFIGWDKQFDDIRSDLNVYAIFEESSREYTVNFYNEDNSLLKTMKVPYGSSAVEPETPTKEGTQQYSYIFSSWDKDFKNIVANLNVYAQYEEVVNSFTVTFNDAYGNVYQEETLVYGTIITLPEEGPEKATDEYFSYLFIEWDGYITGMTIRENLTFEPLYETTGVIYEIVIIVDSKETYYELAYGDDFPNIRDLKEATNKYTYALNGAIIKGEFIKLEDLPETVKESVTLDLKYISYIKRSYYISYLNEINLKTIRSYNSLVEAYNKLEEVSEENYEELLALFNEKVAIYNELVEDLNTELEIVDGYEEKIFKGLLEISSSMQSLSYLIYFSMRKGFYYA